MGALEDNNRINVIPNLIPMDVFKNTLLSLEAGDFTEQQIVSILVLCADKLQINTISEMARLEGKTPRGIKISNQYKKVKIGKQTLAIKGVAQDNLPF